VSPRRDPSFWSSCCGESAEYIGYYRCTGCKQTLNMGRAKQPCMISDSFEAGRIREARAAERRGEQLELFGGGAP
jgi:hypothetical protein